MRARIVFYNEKTGEIYEEIDKVLIIGTKPYITDKNFVKVFVGFLRDVLEDEELGSGAWKLLLYTIQNMEYNSLRVSMIPDEVANELGVTKRTFYNWLKILIKNGYLEKLATNIYRLKPYTAVRGNMEQTLKVEPDF
jgi:hypothetical protein